MKIEDLCLCLRELKLPIFRFMVLNYVNALVAGTDVADKLKHKEVRRHWYYNWLGGRCERLRTSNITPLELTRAQWAAAENAKAHYDLLASIQVDANLAVANKPKLRRVVAILGAHQDHEAREDMLHGRTTLHPGQE